MDSQYRIALCAGISLKVCGIDPDPRTVPIYSSTFASGKLTKTINERERGETAIAVIGVGVYYINLELRDFETES